jgi:hypothetical protein
VLADPNVDIFQTVVQRGLNWLFDQLNELTLTCNTEPAAADVCVNVPAPVNMGLQSHGNTGYATPIIGGAIGAASASAPNRLVEAGLGSQNANFVAGRTYAEITQRVANAVVWGQSDSGNGQGGWFYGLEQNDSDGSTLGWSFLGLIDMAAGGATILPGVRSQVALLLDNVGGQQLNSDGSFDYRVNTTQASDPGHTRVGIGLQGLAFAQVPAADPRVTLVRDRIATNWNVSPFGEVCNQGSPQNWNKGCGYSMFNIFKGLRLYGINSLAIGDPDGAGPLADGDWYGDYVNNLLANQKNVFGDNTRGEWSVAGPAAQTGGGTVGASMDFSCCHDDTNGITSLALLILAPTAFVPPDPGLFSKVGLSPQSDSNPPGTDHTVTATAQSSGGAPVPGVLIDFKVLTGPNSGKGATGVVTNAAGQATFTYNDDSVAPWPQTDTIQASIGSGANTLFSNIVSKTWQPPVSRCDVAPAGAPNGIVDQADLNAIRAKNGQAAAGPDDPFDGNGDGFINVADVRYCQLRLGPVGGTN